MRNHLRKILPVIAISLILIMAAMLYYTFIVYNGTINQIDSNFRSHIGHAAMGFDGSPTRSITALEHINRAVALSRHTSYGIDDVSYIGIISTRMRDLILKDGKLPDDESIQELFSELSKQPTNEELWNKIILKLQ